MQSLLRDLQFAARILIRERLFALVAVSMLALGIGANTAIFSHGRRWHHGDGRGRGG
jgi:hypothetical protein